jgi:hypothetical protein
VVAFLTEHMPVARGNKVDWGEIYGGFREWQAKLGHEVSPATQFGAVLRHICEQANTASGGKAIGFIAWIGASHGRAKADSPHRSLCQIGGTRLTFMRSLVDLSYRENLKASPPMISIGVVCLVISKRPR